ncbi:2218_t:CDS:2 [Funneliformis geosporum]|uniref:14695_t:CDS:1 n=1 Tax=Funneliformis geosporum TaxID=1117311 RepID=A0A9W4WM18_9GLOM|nr:2218_t:CDS:2 [Funneliformis geosporum]CAI2172086.1 14695_t:CDS:2 [Funneliformis geosporum]
MDFSLYSHICGSSVVYEVPLLIIPKFISDKFIKTFENNYVRTAGYLLFATSMMIIGIVEHWAYILPGITLAITGLCYCIAAIKHQEHKASSITGGTGVGSLV